MMTSAVMRVLDCNMTPAPASVTQVNAQGGAIVSQADARAIR
jgi:hypothetical protein